MKPHLHAESSAKKFGGKMEDYLEIHEWFDLCDIRFFRSGSQTHR